MEKSAETKGGRRWAARSATTRCHQAAQLHSQHVFVKLPRPCLLACLPDCLAFLSVGHFGATVLNLVFVPKVEVHKLKP